MPEKGGKIDCTGSQILLGPDGCCGAATMAESNCLDLETSGDLANPLLATTQAPDKGTYKKRRNRATQKYWSWDVVNAYA